MTIFPRTTATGASIGQVFTAFKAFVSANVRIDKWVLDEPSVNPTLLEVEGVEVPYPSNTAIEMPIQRANFYDSEFGLTCEADFYFKIVYRFSKLLRFDQLPLSNAQNILNNLYFHAVRHPASINKNIREVRTPDVGTDVVVRPVDQENTSDWLIILQPAFRATFKAALGALDGIQPGPGEEPPIILNAIKMDIHRAFPETFDPSRLDRTLEFDY